MDLTRHYVGRVSGEFLQGSELLGLMPAPLLEGVMKFIDDLEYRFLCRSFPCNPDRLSGRAYAGRSKIKVLLGNDIFERLRGKTVVDFGCGYGDQTIELAQQGAARVIGVDIRNQVLEKAAAKATGYPNVEFLNATHLHTNLLADFVLSIDSFEHVAEPERVLVKIYELLKPGGYLLVSFGPPWLHPFGGHVFSPLPWSHKILTENALIRWHNSVKQAHVARFEEVGGGLNRMTVRRFERLAHSSPFREVVVTPVPMRKLRWLHNPITREFTTAVVRAELRR
jgi:SAM-dependent methyltransferase